jgi:hypothetical protein
MMIRNKKFRKLSFIMSSNDMKGFGVGITFKLDNEWPSFSFVFLRLWKHTIQIQWGGM